MICAVVILSTPFSPPSDNQFVAWLNYALEFIHVQNILYFFMRTNPTMTIEQIQNALKDRNLQAVAEATGLNAATLYRISRGKGKPHAATLRALSQYLQG